MTGLPFFFFFFFKLYSSIARNHCRVQCHSRREPGLTRSHPRPHYDHFFVPNSINQATKMKQYRNEVGLDGICMDGYYKWLVLPAHGVSPWEDAILPPHEFNSWEDYRHEHMSFHYMYLNMRRTLDLPPHELNHWEVHLSSTRGVTVVNHSSPPIHVECL